MRSLRLRLILLLGAAIMAAAAIQFATSFRASMLASNKLFDYHMQQMAFALQDNDFEKFEWYTLPDTPNEGFDFVIQVWTADGARAYQTRTYRALPERAALGYSTVTLDNGSWRIYALQTHKQMIQIAQKIQARRDRAISLALNSLWPIIPVSFLLLLAAWWVITSALAPLNRVGHDLASRKVDSFDPVSDLGVPTEVSPLLAQLNSLLERFAQTLQSQRHFVADAAHELRSPLTALKLQVQTLARAKDETARGQAIARLEGGVDRAARLVEQLLALARQDPVSPIEFDMVSLTACIRQAVADVAPFAASRQIDLRLEGLSEVALKGDDESLRIMLRNLLDNAVRYSKQPGMVDITLTTTADHVELTIRDYGSGIPQQERARVFDRFYRVSGNSANGSGLGLAIVKAIADRHRAMILLEDPPLGGLAVKIVFPFDPEASRLADAARSQPS